eukprot:COSAG02_NODE_5970_length_3901_cov_12.420831_3_plen_353_part_00
MTIVNASLGVFTREFEHVSVTVNVSAWHGSVTQKTPQQTVKTDDDTNTAASSVDQGTFIVAVNGIDTSHHIVALAESAGTVQISADRRTLTLAHGTYSNNSTPQGTRIWVSRDGEMNSNSYVHFSLLGKTLRYTVDLSHVPCSCNAALYWVAMPGYDIHGRPAPSLKGNYYCDSNKVWGVDCWEMDSLEGNQHVMKVTPHSCSDAAGGYIRSCDGAGPFPPTGFSPRDALCPAVTCTIDTRRPFTHTQTFVVDTTGDVLLEIQNTVEQDGSKFTFNATGTRSYLAKMSAALNQGMVLTFQLWGKSWVLMSWLDGTRCVGECPTDSTVTYSNISVSNAALKSDDESDLAVMPI